MLMNKIFKFFFSIFLVSLGHTVFASPVLREENLTKKNIPEQHIVVVITSFNNKDWYKENLDSVYKQNYTNYHLIYIDDCSKDGTGDLVKEYIHRIGQDYRTTLILNQEWESQMANHYKAVHMCDDNDIVLHLDGDDRFYDENVFSKINEVYSNEDIWMTLGRPLFSTGQRWRETPAHIMETIQKNISYRQHGWSFTHLRTFRAWLFKHIKLQDLLYKGNFANISPAPDVAFSYPMLEMAAYHNCVLDDLLYIVNVKNPLSQCYLAPKEQVEIDQQIKFSWQRYTPLTEPNPRRKLQNIQKKTDIILIWPHLETINDTQLNSAIKKIDGIQRVFIVYDERIINESLKFKICNVLPEVELIPCNQENIKNRCFEIFCNANDYIILADELDLKTKTIDCLKCIADLEKTQAHAFYLNATLSSKIIETAAYIKLSKEIYGWQPNYTRTINNSFEKLGMILYSKETILNQLMSIDKISLKTFSHDWPKLPREERAVGLIFA